MHIDRFFLLLWSEIKIFLRVWDTCVFISPFYLSFVKAHDEKQISFCHIYFSLPGLIHHCPGHEDNGIFGHCCLLPLVHWDALWLSGFLKLCFCTGHFKTFNLVLSLYIVVKFLKSSESYLLFAYYRIFSCRLELTFYLQTIIGFRVNLLPDGKTNLSQGCR